jgi:Ca2+-binding EF-hand superfamily protein
VDSSKALESKFFRLANNDIELDTPSLEVQGRSVAIRRSARKSDIAWFTFNELCDKPLGSADYITLAKRFHTVFLEAIPQLTLQELNQARRLITLIDALYDHGTRIFFSCQAETIGEIFHVDAVTRRFSSLDEVFAWDRTVSRLTEMTSVEYQIKHARKLSAKQFFGQYDLLGDSINENELREIFARYDKNNDGIIALAGLNRMINDINLYISEGSSPDDALIAAPQLIQSFTGSTEGKRIHFDRFKRVVGEKGLLSMIP